MSTDEEIKEVYTSIQTQIDEISDQLLSEDNFTSNPLQDKVNYIELEFEINNQSKGEIKNGTIKGDK